MRSKSEWEFSCSKYNKQGKYTQDMTEGCYKCCFQWQKCLLKGSRTHSFVSSCSRKPCLSYTGEERYTQRWKSFINTQVTKHITRTSIIFGVETRHGWTVSSAHPVYMIATTSLLAVVVERQPVHVSQGQQLGMHDIHTRLSDKSSVYGGVQFEDDCNQLANRRTIKEQRMQFIIINPLTSKTSSLSYHPTRKVKLETRIHRWQQEITGQVDQVEKTPKKQFTHILHP